VTRPASTDVALREIRFGRVWRANAYRLVAERDGLLVLWSPSGSERFLPVDSAGVELRIPRDEPWVLGTRTTEQHALSLVRPGARHSVTLHWSPEWRFLYWYVNLERWLGRGRRTIDYVDEKLDLVITPDGSVGWKDEDELEQAAALGLLDGDEVRAEAERVLAAPPWPTGWEAWRPDPSWPAPVLPDGWDVVELLVGR
jgi:hypothetical protein